MNGGNFRAPRPLDTKSAARSESAPRQPEPVTPAVASQPEPVVTSSRRLDSEPKRPKKLLWIGLIVVVIIIGVIASLVIFKSQNAATGIDKNKYQAVFFTNGQVYFGKLQPFNSEYLRLTDIYYLQTQSGAKDDSENPQQTTPDNGNVQLIKLGEEIHGPEDEMIISRDQVLFYENIKQNGKVAQSIQTYKSSN